LFSVLERGYFQFWTDVTKPDKIKGAESLPDRLSKLLLVMHVLEKWAHSVTLATSFSSMQDVICYLYQRTTRMRLAAYSNGLKNSGKFVKDKC